MQNPLGRACTAKCGRVVRLVTYLELQVFEMLSLNVQSVFPPLEVLLDPASMSNKVRISQHGPPYHDYFHSSCKHNCSRRML